MRLTLLLAAALLSGAAPGTAIAAQPDPELTIVQSAGPSANRYPQGARLPADTRLTLRPGDRVVVARGTFARIFRGPGSFAARDFATPDARQRQLSDISAVRGPRPPAPPEPVGTGGDRNLDGPLSRFVICPADRRCPR